MGSAQFEGSSIVGIVGALAHGLDSARYRLHACFLNGGGPLSLDLAAQGVHVHTMNWARGMRDLAGAWWFWRHLRPYKFDIVHQHWGGRTPRLLAGMLGNPSVIAHLHGHLSESKDLAPLRFRLYGAHVVIATSRAVAACILAQRLRVVYPGISVSDRQSTPTQPKRLGETVLGTAGRLVPLKGIEYLIHSLPLLHKDNPCVRLEIAGSGPDRDVLEREVQLHGLENRVRFLGWRSDLAQAMAGWDVYVQPSVGEPFGIAALEAMAIGLPVIGTQAGGLSELVEHGITGWLVPPRNPIALADRLEVLLRNPDLRRRMGAAGRARARARFSLNRMVKSISNIYDEVLAERKIGSTTCN
jgi:glycosyltransferase involved in cell wall biosynthesis